MSTSSVISRITPRILQRRNVGWIGIDVGSRQIKLAQVERRGDRWSLRHHDVLVPPEGEFATCAVTAIAERRLLSSPFVGRNLACAVSMSVSELLTMELPDGTDDELRLMIEQNLESADGDDKEPRQFAFWRGQFARHLDDEMTQVHVTTAKRNMVRTIADGLFRQGLYCQIFDVVPFALVRAATMVSSADARRPVAMFDWSGQKPLFMVVQNHTPIFTRQFRHGGVDQIVQLLGTRLGLNTNECRHLLSEYRVDDNSTQTSEPNFVRQIIAEILAEPLKLLAHEFNKTLSYVKQQRSDSWPERLWICGEGASLAGVETAVENMTGIESHLWQLGDGTAASPAQQALLCTAAALSSLAYNV